MLENLYDGKFCKYYNPKMSGLLEASKLFERVFKRELGPGLFGTHSTNRMQTRLNSNRVFLLHFQPNSFRIGLKMKQENSIGIQRRK